MLAEEVVVCGSQLMFVERAAVTIIQQQFTFLIDARWIVGV